MIENRKILAIIPARGGSKGLPFKNTLPLCGKPLLGWTIEAAQQSKYVDRTIVSSDDQEIIRIAKEFDCETPFVRPKNLSLDSTPSAEVIKHAIERLPGYDIIAILQVTSPLRDHTDIDLSIKEMVSKNAHSCVSVCQNEKSPNWMFNVNEQGYLKPLLEFSDAPRQSLPITYYLNGAIYLVETQSFLHTGKLLTPNSIPYIMRPEHSVDIDTLSDLEYAEHLVLSRQKQYKKAAGL